MLGIRVDVDTLWGLERGVKNLLDLFDEFEVKATFFIPLGPDGTGKAIKRIFLEKGFWKRMVRLRSVYGRKGILYGTILPSPRMGDTHPEILREIEKKGHEVGIHGFDHCHWRDNLLRMGEVEIDLELVKATHGFQKIFQRAPFSSAAPGWRCTEKSLRVQERYSFQYSSDTRGTSPFFPLIQIPTPALSRGNFQTLKTLQLPVTLPTLDELIPLGEEKKLLDLVQRFNQPNHPLPPESPETSSGSGTHYHVYTAHAEVEGGPKLILFRDFLERVMVTGTRIMPLEKVAQDFLSRREEIPNCRIGWIKVPGRTMDVACQLNG